jgi:GNAT superfamily N-acetyltransferase
MNKEITYRPAVLEDAEALAGLVGSMFKVQRSGEFYVWQCFKNIVPVVVMCAFADDELIGSFGIQKRELSGGIKCGHASWLGVLPKWQGKGIFKKLGEMAINYFNDLDLLCVIANDQANIACEKSFGFKAIGSLKTITLKSLSGPQDKELERQCITKNTNFRTMSGNAGGFMMFDHSEPYRKWRYTLNPMYSYDMLRLETGEYAIVKKFMDSTIGNVIGDIVDYECPLDNPVKLKCLFEGVRATLKNDGIDILSTWENTTALPKDIMTGLGFRADGYRSHFCVKIVNDELTYLQNMSGWHLLPTDAANY